MVFRWYSRALTATFSASRRNTSVGGIRTHHTAFPTLTARRLTLFATTTLLIGLPTAAFYLDGDGDHDTPEVREQPSILSLLRSYAVFTICSVPPVVDHAPDIISALLAVPGIKQLAELGIKYTFFDQFVGGESVSQTIPLIAKLRRQGKGVLLVYSVEHDDGNNGAQHEGSYRQNIVEMERAIDTVGDFEEEQRAQSTPPGKTWIAIKLTALLPSDESLSRLSIFLCSSRSSHALSVPYPHTPTTNDLSVLELEKSSIPSPLTEDDVIALKTLYDDLRRICSHASKRGVPVFIDAEHSWYTPAIDALTMALSREFNRPSPMRTEPLVYGTYQSYLRRGVSHLQASIADAKKHGYMLGVKLVRGAYQPLEVSVHTNGAKSPEDHRAADPPVWCEKADTDDTYNSSINIILSSLKSDRLKDGVPVVSAMFATHNQESCDIVLNGLVERGMAIREVNHESQTRIRIPQDVADRISFGQLLGMRDDLTQYLTDIVISPSPVVLKYVPYGALHDVIPYLARRAIENKSVLGGKGGASDERRVAGAELRRRIFSL